MFVIINEYTEYAVVTDFYDFFQPETVLVFSVYLGRPKYK